MKPRSRGGASVLEPKLYIYNVIHTQYETGSTPDPLPRSKSCDLSKPIRGSE